MTQRWGRGFQPQFTGTDKPAVKQHGTTSVQIAVPAPSESHTNSHHREINRPWIGEDSVAANNAKVAELDPSVGGNVVAAAPTFSPSLFGGAQVALVPVTSAPVASTNAVAPATTTITGVPNGQFDEYALASASQPHDVIVDSSGNTWVLEAGANKVAKIIAPDFGVFTNSISVSVAQGASNDSLIMWGSSIQGYSGSVTLSVTGVVPAGVTFSSFDGNPINIAAGAFNVSSLTVYVGSSVPVGSYPITVSGTDGSVTHAAVFTLVVTPGSSTSKTTVTTGSSSKTIAPLADFSVLVSPTSVMVKQGDVATLSISVKGGNGFKDAVSLTVTPSVAELTATFSPTSGNPNFDSTLSLTVAASLAAGTYPLLITAAAGGKTHSTSVTLTVEETAGGVGNQSALGGYILPGIGVVAVAVVVVILALRSRGRKSPPISVPPPTTGTAGFCINCGKTLQASSKFCPKCGEKQTSQ